MTKRSSLSIAAVLAASALALQAPIAGAQSTDARGVPGVEANVGNNASDRGVPGVEMNVGRQGDQNNVNSRALGAGADTGTTAGANTGGTGSTMGARAGAGVNTDGTTSRPMRADRG